MNKLTLAATLALAMGGYAMAADDCSPGVEKAPPGQALVYDLVIKVKTTAAKPGKIKAVKGSLCAPGGDADIDLNALCYRVKTSKTFNGIIYACTNYCEDFVEVSQMDLWNKKEKLIYADGSDVTWNAFWRIGKNLKIAELEWVSAEGYGWSEMVAQGFGNWDKVHLKNANGNILIKFDAPVAYSKSNKPFIPGTDNEAPVCDCVAYPWNCSGGALLEDADWTVGFGTWKLKYNKKASAKYMADGDLPSDKIFWNDKYLYAGDEPVADDEEP